MLGIFVKRPADQVDYDVCFARWLPDDDSLVSAAATVDPGESMVSVIQTLAQPDSVKVWLVDGEPGKTATVTITANTAQNRIKQVQFQIRVRD